MNLLQYNRKKKGILEVKVEKDTKFPRELADDDLKKTLIDIRRETAFLLNRMKSHIKKGFRKQNEGAILNYNNRFSKLMNMMLTWRHYIITYYKIKEDRYYEELYATQKYRRQGQMNSKADLEDEKARESLVAEHTLSLTQSVARLMQERPGVRKNGPDTFKTINIGFFLEEFYLYMVEVFTTTAGLALTYPQITIVPKTLRVFTSTRTLATRLP